MFNYEKLYNSIYRIVWVSVALVSYTVVVCSILASSFVGYSFEYLSSVSVEDKSESEVEEEMTADAAIDPVSEEVSSEDTVESETATEPESEASSESEEN